MSPDGWPRPTTTATTWSWSFRPCPAKPTNWWRWCNEMCEFPSEREYDVMVATGEQVSIALLAMCLQSMGYKAKSYMWLSDSDHHRQRLLQGPHRGDRRYQDPRRSEERHHRGRRRFPGDRPRGEHHHPWPRRFRYLGGGRGRGPQGRCLRDLHRRRRRLHHRPAHCAGGVEDGEDLLRRDAGDWPPSARRCCRSARWNLPRNTTWSSTSVQVSTTIQGPW